MNREKKAKWPKYPTRGNSVGRCNICGHLGRLTDDHVPPKGGPRVSTKRMHQLFRVLGDGIQPTGGRQAQGGVNFRTLCTKCNSSRLGAQYDPALIQLTIAVDQFISSLKVGLIVPSFTFVETKPQRVLRAVIGHTLAGSLDRVSDGDWDKELVEYFLKPDLSFPASARIYYWVYPYDQQIIIRDASYLSLLKSTQQLNPTLIMCLKFYPLAFLIADNRNLNYQFNLPCLSEHGGVSLDANIYLPIHLKQLPRETWPEAPSPEHLIVYGGDPLYAR